VQKPAWAEGAGQMTVREVDYPMSRRRNAFSSGVGTATPPTIMAPKVSPWINHAGSWASMVRTVVNVTRTSAAKYHWSHRCQRSAREQRLTSMLVRPMTGTTKLRQAAIHPAHWSTASSFDERTDALHARSADYGKLQWKAARLVSRLPGRGAFLVAGLGQRRAELEHCVGGNPSRIAASVG